MIINIFNNLSILKRKIKYKNISYSLNGVDLIVDYIFKNKNSGIYIDIGAQHPISNNNTYLLFHNRIKKYYTGNCVCTVHKHHIRHI